MPIRSSHLKHLKQPPMVQPKCIFKCINHMPSPTPLCQQQHSDPLCLSAKLKPSTTHTHTKRCVHTENSQAGCVNTADGCYWFDLDILQWPDRYNNMMHRWLNKKAAATQQQQQQKISQNAELHCCKLCGWLLWFFTCMTRWCLTWGIAAAGWSTVFEWRIHKKKTVAICKLCAGSKCLLARQ